MKQILWAILSLLIVAGCGERSSSGDVSAPDLKIGRMKVSIWPEYDTQGVLVVYEGKFYDRERFPAKASLQKGSIFASCIKYRRGGDILRPFSNSPILTFS